MSSYVCKFVLGFAVMVLSVGRGFAEFETLMAKAPKSSPKRLWKRFRTPCCFWMRNFEF
jgi:hypothetical protein